MEPAIDPTHTIIAVTPISFAGTSQWELHPIESFWSKGY